MKLKKALLFIYSTTMLRLNKEKRIKEDQIFVKFKARIGILLGDALETKPIRISMNHLWLEEEFKSLSLAAKEELFDYAYRNVRELLRENTILLYDIGDGNKSIFNPTGSYSGTVYWLDVKHTCTPNGIITITKTPTNKIYIE